VDYNLTWFIHKPQSTQNEIFESIEVIKRQARYYLFFLLPD